MSYWEKANHSWSQDSIRYINTPSEKSKELFYYVQEIGYFKASRPYFTERENLPSFLMKFTHSGKGCLAYKNQKYILEAGDIFFIDCMDYQHYQTISEEPWEMYWVHFYGGNSELFYQEFMKNGSNVFHSNTANLENPIHLILRQLLHVQENRHAQTDFQSSVLLHQLLNELLIQKNQLDFTYEEIPDYVLAMKAFIDRQFKESLSMEQLEKQFHINKYQLNREFSRFIGQPPINYQINKKISFAKDLLRYSDQSIQEIALELGWDNFAYFSRLFKKKTGLTPGVYRKIG
ncbi:AraC family transcriptional regulator [Enterococcus sp. CWB-B31]|uniref:AraC family transcriptional regulator n=1 Tax=Enterococcus sp. CWB-B31 TaxID=2885159 RepID=UPI001E282F6E|nr:AraC family transcriptional regulator [Enterococcus sp. CWB-B31]MCB5954332.1 AraC family transcriptional regulator [Enterococcus sp. CWB-B31]